MLFRSSALLSGYGAGQDNYKVEAKDRQMGLPKTHESLKRKIAASGFGGFGIGVSIFNDDKGPLATIT